MTKILILITFLISFNSYSQVSQGDKLSSTDYNNSVFRIGDIKSSILSLSQFQSIHGSCWIQLNQNTTDISISGSDLEGVIGSSSIKSSYGRVLRSQGTNSAALGQHQEDATAVNGLSVQDNSSLPSWATYIWARNTANDGSHEDVTSGSSSNNFEPAREDDFDHDHPLASSDPETRMMNLTINTFIKINNSCL